MSVLLISWEEKIILKLPQGLHSLSKSLSKYSPLSFIVLLDWWEAELSCSWQFYLLCSWKMTLAKNSLLQKKTARYLSKCTWTRQIGLSLAANWIPWKGRVQPATSATRNILGLTGWAGSQPLLEGGSPFPQQSLGLWQVFIAVVAWCWKMWSFCVTLGCTSWAFLFNIYYCFLL